MTKEDYIKYTNNNFTGKAKALVLKQIELFYQRPTINKTKYNIGDKVFLKKGTYLHGILSGLEGFDWIVENGFLGNDFTGYIGNNKIKNSIGMWDIREDCYLKDYINIYSGFTITYSIGRGPGSTIISELIPYHKFDEYTEKINNRKDVWMWWGDQTKEVRFLPSLVANKNQIAFILNMESSYAKEIIKGDVWNTELDEETLKPFLDYRYYEMFITKDRLNRDASTTDRESAIIFGLPPFLIEGVFVGRELEKDKEKLNHIKNKLPDCYICNLDGIVIAE